jgi:hypothetical protein
MLARGWREVPLDGGAWEFCYADVGWIHEFITYTVRPIRGCRGSAKQG